MSKPLASVLSLLLALICVVSQAACKPTEVGTIAIYPEDCLRDFCVIDKGTTYVEFPGARRWALLAGQDDYCAMPVQDVKDALEAIAFPVEKIAATLLILPAPRRDLPGSSAEGSIVFLSPGRVCYQREHVHYTVVHEVGHVVQHVLMPDSRRDLWLQYAALRGFVYAGRATIAEHASRPHEIFAEDFRALFGGELARCGSGVENHALSPPGEVPGLREFFLALTEAGGGTSSIRACPNPFAERVFLENLPVEGVSPSEEVSIFDVEGRLVCSLKRSGTDRGQLVWEGLDLTGRAVQPGLYFLVTESADGRHLQKVVKAP